MDASAIALAAGKVQGSHSPLIFCIKRFDVRARQTYNYSCSCRKNNVSGNGAFFLLAIVLFFSKMPLHFLRMEQFRQHFSCGLPCFFSLDYDRPDPQLP